MQPQQQPAGPVQPPRHNSRVKDAVTHRLRLVERNNAHLEASNTHLRQSVAYLERVIAERDGQIDQLIAMFERLKRRLHAAEDEVYRLTHPFREATNRARLEPENIAPPPPRINLDIARAAFERAELFQCARCKQAVYPSREAQIEDWPAHQEICSELANQN